MSGESAALEDPRLEGVPHEVLKHGPVDSLAAAASARGMEVSSLLKTMVVRVSEGDFVFVLVPGDRVIDWPKLRDHLGVNRLSLPDAETARDATGYVRGTITPLGSSHRWPVVADQRIEGRRVNLGAGAHGLSITIDGDDLIRLLDARTAEVTRPS